MLQKHQKNLKELEECFQVQAAIRVQSLFRGYKSRILFTEFKEVKEQYKIAKKQAEIDALSKLFNKGKIDHEFVMDVHEGIMEHKALMEKFPEMEHADPNAIRLAPGSRGEIIWTFANAGEFGFACLVPGHYDSGMKGDITVAN